VSYPPDNLNWDRLKADIRRAADCVDVYERLHSDPAGKVRDGGTVRCIDPQHEDRDPSMSLHTDGFKCHSCGASGDVFDMWALTYGRSTDGEDFKQTAAELADDCGFNLETYTRDGETVDVERPPPPVPRESKADGGSTWTASTSDPPDVRRDVFADVWSVVRPLTLTPEAETWLESRSIPPHVAYAYGCRDWRPAMGDLFDVFRDYTRSELHRAGMVNDDGEPWWPLRAYQQGNDDEHGLAVPVWHPDYPEAPVAVRWRTYSPDAYRKAYQQPSGPGRFQQPPLGLCEPAPATQIMLGASWLNASIDVETAREWMEDETPRPVGAYPGTYAVVLCEGETDWLSVASAALELEAEIRIVPVGITAKSAALSDTTLDAIAGADHVHVALDGTNDDDSAPWRARCEEIVNGLVTRKGPRAQSRFTYTTYPEDCDLNDLRTEGRLTEKLDSWIEASS
jgi:hypothetical protein